MLLIENPLAVISIKIFAQGEALRYKFKAASMTNTLRADISLDEYYNAWLALGNWINAQNTLNTDAQKDPYYRLHEVNRQKLQDVLGSIQT